MFGLPLLQHFVTATASRDSSLVGWQVDPLTIVGLILVLALLAVWLLSAILGPAPPERDRRSKRRPERRPRGQRTPTANPPAGPPRETVLIDGSNVMHWLDNTPQLAPLLQVVHDLSRQGLRPGVVFDANVGYKLTGKFMGERDLSRMLSLPRDQILVVPKGTQADPFLLETARDLNARIVTNDRFRDWTDRYPDVAKPDRLVRGEMRDGRVWLKGLGAKAEEKEGAL